VSGSDRGRLGQTEVADLARLHELRHRADGLLDGDIGIDAVLVIEVDVIGAQAGERSFDGAARVRGTPIERTGPRVSGSIANPNFVAISTSLRRPAIARRTSSSLT
jgi:hypothetical protein